MTYLLDTNAWIGYVNQRSSAIVAKMSTLLPSDVRLCSVVLGELFYGAYHSSRPSANLALVASLQNRFLSLPFDDLAADVFGRIRADLVSQGAVIGPYDLQIGAIALANKLTLVTHNTGEFSRVPGLAIEDWEASP